MHAIITSRDAHEVTASNKVTHTQQVYAGMRKIYREPIAAEPCQGICDLTPELLASYPAGMHDGGAFRAAELCVRACARACMCVRVYGAFWAIRRCCCHDFDGAALLIRLQAREPFPTLLPAHTKDCRDYHGRAHRIAPPHQVV